MNALRVYGNSISGNCYKVRLLLELLGRDYAWTEVDTLRGAARTPEFLSKNPNGKVPLLELEDGRLLPESNAILYLLARETPFFPDDAFVAAEVFAWMFFEQYSHEPYIAVSRSIVTLRKVADQEAERLAANREPGYQALRVMEQRLAGRKWLAGEACSIADIALFAYTHVAHEGGFSLEAFPEIRTWIERMQGLPGFVAMPAA